MRVIDVSKPEKLRRITCLSYGHSRSGKTRFAGTWPRPLFLSDATESGWTTLTNMDRQALYEPGKVPQVWAIENITDMFKALKDVEPLVKRGEVQTLVIDSLTFYQDLFVNFIERSLGGRSNPREVFGKLSAHLKELREQVHLIGTNVVWLALAKDPGEDQPVGGPMLTGQNAAKFAAGCDYVFYHRSHQPTANSRVQWEIRTRKFGSYAAGGRDEGLLPDPLGYNAIDDDDKEAFVADCTYRTLSESLGLLAPASGDEFVSARQPETPAAPAAPPAPPAPSASAPATPVAQAAPAPAGAAGAAASKTRTIVSVARPTTPTPGRSSR